jgi:hypothetical protein
MPKLGKNCLVTETLSESKQALRVAGFTYDYHASGSTRASNSKYELIQLIYGTWNAVHAAMITSASVDSNSSRRSLSLTVLRWSQERVHTTKSIINDMLGWPELYDREFPHLQAALAALEKAETELNSLN